MEEKENSVCHIARKSRSPQPSRRAFKLNSQHQNQYVVENLKKSNSAIPKLILPEEDTNDRCKMEPSPKTDESSEKEKMQKFSDDLNTRRPSTAANTFRKRVESEEREWNANSKTRKPPPSRCKNCPSDRKSHANVALTSIPVNVKEKKQCPNKNGGTGTIKKIFKVAFLEGTDGIPLLSLAACEQEEIIEILHLARNNFIKKIKEMKGRNEAKSKPKMNVALGDHESVFEKAHSEELRKSYSFEETYNNNLDDVFHVWIHLFYFIVNLRINLIKIVNMAGTEAFKPNAELERNIVTRAIECVKFFSKLKMKTLMESLEEFRSVEHPKKREMEILEYEERTSTPFLLEMNYMGEKAKEIVNQVNCAS